MELVPIIYRILVISGMLLGLVLFLSYITSKISMRKKGNKKRDKNIRNARNLSQNLNYLHNEKRKFVSGETNNFAERVNSTGTNVKGVRVIRKSDQQLNKTNNFRYTRERIENWKKSQPRFLVLNENTEPEKVYSKQTNEFRIFYNKNYSNTG